MLDPATCCDEKKKGVRGLSQHPTTAPAVSRFAIYQILLGWKTCKCCHETDKLPNPRPTQPKKK